MKILVIDDHPLILDALSQLLPQLGDRHRRAHRGRRPPRRRPFSTTSPTSRWCCSISRCPARAASTSSPTSMLDYPGVPIVVLSATHDRATVSAALAAGARGFIAKTADARDAARRRPAGARRRRISDAATSRSMPDGDGVHIAPGALGLTRAADRRAEAARAGQAQQAHLPRPQRCPRARSRSTSARS